MGEYNAPSNAGDPFYLVVALAMIPSLVDLG
jgi:hypothetical protein